MALISYILYLTVVFSEAALLVFLLLQGRWRRLRSLCLYAAVLFAVDGVARPGVQYYFGFKSSVFGNFYWSTDVLLALSAFLLTCAFFHRACAQEAKMWQLVRLLLLFVFILVLGVSLISILQNYGKIYTKDSFIVPFGQNLYFTCLVLNTLLYLLLQKVRSADDELGLLVCGMGIQFAGPAATLALYHLTAGEAAVQSLGTFIMPLCTLGTLLTWFYAVARMPKPAALSAGEQTHGPGGGVKGKVPNLEEAALSKA